MTPDAHRRLLAATRYTVLIGGTVTVGLILSRTIPAIQASGLALAWVISFQLGLRGQALLGHARKEAAKQLSWSWALVTSFAVATALVSVMRTPHWRLILFVLAWEAGTFYCVGKLTCALAGCCAADPRTHIAHPPLAIWELAATVATLGMSTAVALYASYGSGLEVLTVSHAVTRFGSRYGRTLLLRRSLTIDTIGLALVALGAGALPG